MSSLTIGNATVAAQRASVRRCGIRGGLNAMRAPAPADAMSTLQAAVQSRARGEGVRMQAVMKGEGTFIVGGNWKCNGTMDSVKELCAALNAGEVVSGVEVVCAPPYHFLLMAGALLNAPYQVAAQNCWTGKGGAFTGEISAEMLKDAGVPWVILGHSERRALCGESSDVVGTKTAYALSQGLKVIACIGETLEEREAGTTLQVCYSQLKGIAEKVSDWSNVVIAYEPVWAIGTGKVATPEQAQEVHAGVRQWFADNVSPEVANKMRIQYGGSVNAGNCDELAKMEDIDGFLVGGASLKGEDFVTICNASQHST